MEKKFLSEELLIQLIKRFPNDSELGYHIRNKYWEYKTKSENNEKA
jgi:hypothetical protein